MPESATDRRALVAEAKYFGLEKLAAIAMNSVTVTLKAEILLTLFVPRRSSSDPADYVLSHGGTVETAWADFHARLADIDARRNGSCPVPSSDEWWAYRTLDCAEHGDRCTWPPSDKGGLSAFSS